MDQSKRIILAQEKHISKLHENVKSLEKEKQQLQIELDRHSKAAKFYLNMQAEIIKNPLLQSEWERFLSFLKLSMDDAKTLDRDEDDKWTL